MNGYNAGMENFLDAQAKNDIAKMIELQKILKVFFPSTSPLPIRDVIASARANVQTRRDEDAYRRVVRYFLANASRALSSHQPRLPQFNGGGHVNHSIFWTNLTPPKDYSDPEGDIARMIDGQWGSLDKMVSEFNAKAAGVQGSGWGWLGYDKSKDRLVIETTANQDPLATKASPLSVSEHLSLLRLYHQL